MAVEGKNILLGVTGSIAAYKAADLASLLRQAGATVDVVMTAHATRFVTPLTLQTISRRPVHLDPFDDAGWQPEHTALADEADAFVVAPATANALAKFAHGFADDLLSTLFIAARCPVLIAPAMNVHMYENPVVQENLAKLRARGAVIAEPTHGMLACGYEGQGRLQPVEQLFTAIERLISSSSFVRGAGRIRDFAGRRIVVTAGPTREPIDPVRFISNRSSGKMGYAIARAASERGAYVVLISGPTSLQPPAGVEYIPVETAREMGDATRKAADDADIVVFSAAVADYAPATVAEQKIKKQADSLSLALRKTTDWAREIGERKGNRFLVGFAAETCDVMENAKAKLRDKHFDMIVINDVTHPGAGFEVDTNVVTILADDGSVVELPLLPKTQVAHRLLDLVHERLTASTDTPPATNGTA